MFLSHMFLTCAPVGFAARTKLADPAFLEKAEAGSIDEIPTKEFAAQIFQNITDVRVPCSSPRDRILTRSLELYPSA